MSPGNEKKREGARASRIFFANGGSFPRPPRPQQKKAAFRCSGYHTLSHFPFFFGAAEARRHPLSTQGKYNLEKKRRGPACKGMIV